VCARHVAGIDGCLIAPCRGSEETSAAGGWLAGWLGFVGSGRLPLAAHTGSLVGFGSWVAWGLVAGVVGCVWWWLVVC
jgi:hypothetical protein